MLYRRRKHIQGSSQRGFTFLEVLVALAVISISLVALLNSHTVSLKNYLYSQIISRATLLAEEKISEIESQGIVAMDDPEVNEYDNGLAYLIMEGEFFDDEETELYQPQWRLNYWWRSTIEETEYEYVRKITVEVFSRRFVRESVDIDPWDDEQISPTVRLVTYIASTNAREDSRSGSASTAASQATGGR